MQVIDNILPDILATFEPLEQPRHTRQRQPCRIMINGAPVKTRSRKSLWPNIGAAKNAIREHLSRVLHQMGVLIPLMAANWGFNREAIDYIMTTHVGTEQGRSIRIVPVSPE